MQTSLDFYVGKLGFKNVEWGNDDFTSVSRDRAALYICRGGQGRGGAWVWIGVEDAEQLHEDAIAANRRMSLATVYNTLNQFTQAGLLRRIGLLFTLHAPQRAHEGSQS